MTGKVREATRADAKVGLEPTFFVCEKPRGKRSEPLGLNSIYPRGSLRSPLGLGLIA